MYSLYVKLNKNEGWELFVEGLTLPQAHKVLKEGMKAHLFMSGRIMYAGV